MGLNNYSRPSAFEVASTFGTAPPLITDFFQSPLQSRDTLGSGNKIPSFPLGFMKCMTNIRLCTHMTLTRVELKRASSMFLCGPPSREDEDTRVGEAAEAAAVFSECVRCRCPLEDVEWHIEASKLEYRRKKMHSHSQLSEQNRPFSPTVLEPIYLRRANCRVQC